MPGQAEIDRLQQEVPILTSQLKQLERRMRYTMHDSRQHHRPQVTCPPAELFQLLQLAAQAKRQASASHQENARLRARMDRVQRNAQSICAMLAGALSTPVAAAPKQLSTPQVFIQLGVDPALRHQTLLQMRDFRIDSMVSFIDRKTRGLDVHRPFFFYDTYDVEGDSYGVALGVVKFEGATLDAVFGAALDFAVVPRLPPREEEDASTSSSGDGSTDNQVLDDDGTILCRDYEHKIAFQTPRQHRAREIKPLDTQQVITAAFVRRTRDQAVIVTDNADHDDLMPYDLEHKLRVDMTGG